MADQRKNIVSRETKKLGDYSSYLESNTSDAVANEAIKQRDELKKQRNLYIGKSSNLKKELKLLKNQSEDLCSGCKNRLPSPKTQGFLNENQKLQIEIKKKLSTIENVIDMLSNIIGDKSRNDKSRSSDMSSSSSSGSTSSSSESSSSDESENENEAMKDKKLYESNVNYVFFDPETHWCKSCKIFPKSAKDYLNHLHSDCHLSLNPLNDAPWHTSQQDDSFQKNSQTFDKRVPIKGLQFFVPSQAWYCKLCNFWQGDLHCASIHLKSKTHFQNYNKFIIKNPNFEATWLMERQKELNLANSKKGKSLSSQNVIDDNTKSVRVSMRRVESTNKTDIQKNSLKATPPDTKSDDLVTQWNTLPSTMNDEDRKMLESVKNKYKQKESPCFNKKKDSYNRERDRKEYRKSISPSKKRDQSRHRFSPSYNRHHRRKYNSRSRSRSRGKYRSRSREIEKPIVPQFSTEFRPRVEKPKKKVICKKEEDRKKSPTKITDAKIKKLPLIGKMPVFKKQTAKDENVVFTNNAFETLETSKDPTILHSCLEFDDLMPDPIQFASLMAANNNILPPGVDGVEMDYNPMPNIEAPIQPPPSNRPLHKDFEVALDIIFPGEETRNCNEAVIDNNKMNQPLQFKESNNKLFKNSEQTMECKDDDDLTFLGIDSGDTFFSNY